MGNKKRTYWLDLFSIKSWTEFKEAGGEVSGFRKSRWNIVQKIKPGDYLLCYIIGISRFVGVLEVVSEPFEDDKQKIFSADPFPSRMKVKIIDEIDFEYGVPIKEIKELSFFNKEDKPKHYWTSFVRSSPMKWKTADGELVLSAIKNAKENPIKKEIDKKWLTNKNTPKLDETASGKIISIPVDEDINDIKLTNDLLSHTDIQFALSKLGYDLGLKTWVPKNDRNRESKNGIISNLPGLLDELPINFHESTKKTIELIDVLWLKGKSIISAFEIEHTTSIYSGLLRMSDLISLQPNININLYIVAPIEKREKVFNQIIRPTFSHLDPPLPDICSYISYESLLNGIEKIKDIMKYIKPEFIDEIAETIEYE